MNIEQSNKSLIIQEVIMLPNASKICVFLSTEVIASIRLETFKPADYLILKVFRIISPHMSIVTCYVYIRNIKASLVIFQTDKEVYSVVEKVYYQITIVDENYL